MLEAFCTGKPAFPSKKSSERSTEKRSYGSSAFRGRYFWAVNPIGGKFRYGSLWKYLKRGSYKKEKVWSR